MFKIKTPIMFDNTVVTGTEISFRTDISLHDVNLIVHPYSFSNCKKTLFKSFTW